MLRLSYARLLKLALPVLAVLIPASPALAAEEPTLNLSVLGAVHTGEPVQFTGSSTYNSANQAYLTIFVVSGTNSCPSSASAPKGADVVLRREPVDAFLSITDLSDNLSTPGQWVLCGYLSDSSSTLATASVPFVVNGPSGSRGHRSGNHHGGKGHHGGKKHGKH